MPTPPESWSTHLGDEFDRLIGRMVAERGTHDLRNGAGRPISAEELRAIREDVIALATTDSSSLAYQVLLRSGTNAHITDPCPTCESAVRLAWGASRMRRLHGLPADDTIAHAYHAGAASV